MQNWLVFLGGVAGIALLYYGADYLVRSGVAIALRFNVPRLVIGLTLVAFGTSAPELVVSCAAAIENSGDIALGNVIGSNICNIGLILGLCAIITPLPVNRGLLYCDFPAMMIASIAFAALLYFTGEISRISGALFLLALFGYILYQGLRAKKGEQITSGETDEVMSEADISMPKAIIYCIAGLAGLVLGAKFFVNAAALTARLLGISEAVIALTVVAIGTSLPELATSLVAAVRHEQDIAIGNIVGSNLFNILCIIGIAPLIRPLQAKGVTHVDLLTMLIMAGILWLFSTNKSQKLGRFAGVVMFVGYVVYTAWLVINAKH